MGAPKLAAGIAGVYTAAAVLAAITTWGDFRALVRSRLVRSALLSFAFLFAWTLLALCIIRSYSGADWFGDWAEHFQRTLLFLHHFSPQTEITGGYPLPARPPAMNILAAFFLRSSDSFGSFQVIFTFLNLLLFFPCCLAVPRLAGVRRLNFYALTGIFAANPVIFQNATYTWTKSLAAFFVVTALCFYLAAWRRGGALKMAMAFGSLAAGLMVHYSAAPYCLFFGLHYVLFVFPRRPSRGKEAALSAAMVAALVLPWFAWSAAVFGMHATVASNTSVTMAQKYPGGNLERIAANLFDTLVPRLLHDEDTVRASGQLAAAGIRDWAFVLYQKNLIFAMGIVGGPLVLWVLIRFLRRTHRHDARRFWLLFLSWSVLIGIASVGERAPMGAAHLTLIPLEALGLSLLAGYFVKHRVAALLIVAGCAIDFGLGIYLHAGLQHLENTPQRTMFGGMVFANGDFRAGVAFDPRLTAAGWANWSAKHQVKLAEQWSRDVSAYRQDDPAIESQRARALAWLASLQGQDDRMWGGWYRRHGGEIPFLGDAFGDGDALLWVWVALFAGLLWKMARSVPAIPPKAALPRRKSARVSR